MGDVDALIAARSIPIASLLSLCHHAAAMRKGREISDGGTHILGQEREGISQCVRTALMVDHSTEPRRSRAFSIGEALRWSKSEL